ncbi:MAG: Sec-independent protein translocase protein TatB [Gammaproteobacteria bacterium]|nr:Sec-independent protein translocase protein TatB [Gammaproteobacteria bacterium]
MFDIGFWEMAFIGVIALVVIGPERLPGAARNVGLWVGKGRRMLAEIQADVKKEIDAQDLAQVKELKNELTSATRELSDIASVDSDPLGIREAGDGLKESMEEIGVAGKGSRTKPPVNPSPASAKKAAKKKAAKKKTTKKKTAKKKTAKKKTAKRKVSGKKAVSPARKTAKRKVSGKKAVSPARKTAKRKVSGKKAVSPARKTAAKKTAKRKAPGKKSPGSPSATGTARKSAPKKAVKPGSDPA